MLGLRGMDAAALILLLHAPEHTTMQRRHLLLGSTSALLLGAGHAQQQPHAAHADHGAALPPAPSASQPYARLQGGVPHHMSPEQEAQRFVDSPAPAGPAGRWVARAAMPIPRSEMAWAAVVQGRMHVVGGYGEGAVNRDYHHIYDPAADRWLSGAPLPRPRGAAAAVFLDGKLHLIGGASAPTEERASVGWHEVYDPQADRWERRKALPGARDHVGCVAQDGRIHIVGGRFNTFEYNTDLHHVYVAARDTWELRAPLPTARSGHGLVIYRGRYYAMGGEGGIINQPGQQRVFGQMESYDPAADTWQKHAPMPTPRHAVAAVTIGDWIYVAGGGAVLGGGVQSAVHEAFTLS